MRFTLWTIVLWGAVTCVFLGSVIPSGAATYPAISGNNATDWITSVNIDGYKNDSTQEPGGYSYYSSALANLDLFAGTSLHEISVTIKPWTSVSPVYVSAFFDWNQDGDFEDSGETVIVASDVTGSGPHNAAIPVPLNAVAGKTRMRVVLLGYNSQPPSSGIIFWGEAEDYQINVIPISANSSNEWITNVTFGSMSKDSRYEDYAGYKDYTNSIARIKPGGVYPLSVTFGHVFPGPWYIRAFFDWNQDGDFADSGETVIVATAVNSSGPHTANVTVPSWALQNGRTLMRVVLRYNNTPPSLGLFDWGEAEDYSVMGPFPWTMFLPAIIANHGPIVAPFSISSSSFSNNQAIPIRYTLYGTNISPQLRWQNAPTGTDSFMLTVIDPDGGDWLHWKVKLPATTTSLAENAGASGGTNLPSGSTRYDNDFRGLSMSGADGTDYDGPRPPAGTGVHHYNYKVTALNAGGNELNSASITGTYEQN